MCGGYFPRLFADLFALSNLAKTFFILFCCATSFHSAEPRYNLNAFVKLTHFKTPGPINQGHAMLLLHNLRCPYLWLSEIQADHVDALTTSPAQSGQAEGPGKWHVSFSLRSDKKQQNIDKLSDLSWLYCCVYLFMHISTQRMRPREQ